MNTINALLVSIGTGFAVVLALSGLIVPNLTALAILFIIVAILGIANHVKDL